MSYLLDTQVFLWWLENNLALPLKVVQLIENMENELFLSVASIWEINNKANLGKLELPSNRKEFLLAQLKENSIKILSINLEHILEFSTLPRIHNDMFDRLIVAQASIENLPIISRNNIFKEYKIKTVW
jgi:PIN domain nuclease of toxin-antitoxin system